MNRRVFSLISASLTVVFGCTSILGGQSDYGLQGSRKTALVDAVFRGDLTSFLESGLTVGTKVKPDSRKDMFKQAAGTLQWLYQERLPQSVNAENYDDLRNFDFPQFGG